MNSAEKEILAASLLAFFILFIWIIWEVMG